eukprot:jgi/Tetstr1/456384/TSEL_043118.t1
MEGAVGRRSALLAGAGVGQAAISLNLLGLAVPSRPRTAPRVKSAGARLKATQHTEAGVFGEIAAAPINSGLVVLPMGTNTAVKRGSLEATS